MARARERQPRRVHARNGGDVTARKLGARPISQPDAFPQRASLAEAKLKRAADRAVLRAAVLRAVVRCGPAGAGAPEIAAGSGVRRGIVRGLLAELVTAGSVTVREVTSVRRGEPKTVYAVPR